MYIICAYCSLFPIVMVELRDLTAVLVLKTKHTA